MKFNLKVVLAEVLGTFVLVFLGTGAAVFTGADPLQTALVFGLAVTAMAYAVGHVSGGHFNPAVTLAVYLKGKLAGKDVLQYIVAQFVGALLASGLLVLVLGSTQALGANAVSATLVGTDFVAQVKGFLFEVVMTFVFVSAILGVTRKDNPVAGLVIGLVLAGVIVFGFNVTGVSVNPARSFAPALFQGGVALEQVWVFLLAPLAGSALAAYVSNVFEAKKTTQK